MSQDNLDAKQAPYVPVARNGCQLFEIVRRVSLLHPVYYISTTSLTRLFVETVKSRDRGRGCGGKLRSCSTFMLLVTWCETRGC